MSDVTNMFLGEMRELLEKIEEDLIQLENSADSDAIGSIFRYVHTIKGGAGMAHLTALAEYTHHLENLLSNVRNKTIAITPDLISVLLEGLDILRLYADDAEHGHGDGTRLDRNQVSDSKQRILQHSEKVPGVSSGDLTAPKRQPTTPQPSTPTLPPIHEAESQIFLLHIKFKPNYLKNNGNPLESLRSLHERYNPILIVPHVHQVVPIDLLDILDLRLWWSIRLDSTEDEATLLASIKELPGLDGEDVELEVEAVAPPPPAPSNQTLLDAQVVQAGTGTVLPLATPPSQSIQPAPVTKEIVTAQVVPNTIKTPQLLPKNNVQNSIRVPINRLDQIINLVGENVINQVRLDSFQKKLEATHEELGEELLTLIDDNDRTVREMQEQTMSIRMVPIGANFVSLKRLVRDYSYNSDKKIQVAFSGEETEIDKTIGEQIMGPLTHLIRNAMDHGIETPEVRKRAGKDPIGNIALYAKHQDGAIRITIMDDGRGIDTERLYEKAIETGLIPPGTEMSYHEKINLLFSAGLSTAKEVTNISGRGVGMDVVRKEIESLHGSIEINTKSGAGSTFTIKLPLTLAIIEGMIVKVGKQSFAIPLLSVMENLRLNNQLHFMKKRGEFVEIRGEFIPLIPLYKLFNIDNAITKPEEGLVVIVEDMNRKTCILVDRIVDQQPIVIKNIERNFIKVNHLSGATILGDGTLSMILDIPSLFKLTNSVTE